MFEFIGDIVGGGWDAVSNVVTGIGKGVSDFGSGFFPQPQRDKVVSEIVAPVNTRGISYRDITPDARSIQETAAWAEKFWLDSPYVGRCGPGDCKRQPRPAPAVNHLARSGSGT